jgi:RNA polymerase sigma-70 factor (ECF subfamily)
VSVTVIPLHTLRPVRSGSRPENANDFDGVFREHAAKVSRWAAALGGPLVDVEDAVQDVFIIAHRRLPEFRGDAAMATWLFQITRRVILAHRRRATWRSWLRGSAEETAGHLPSLDRTPIEELERRQAAADLLGVLNRMNEKYRTVLVLTKFEGLSADEIAVMTGVTTVTVRVWLHRARLQFDRLVAGGAT